MTRRLLLALALFLGLAACGDDEPVTAATTTAAETTTTTTAETTTTTTAAETTTTTVAPLTPFPPGKTMLGHGERTWAVVLAGGETGLEPEIVAAQAAADAAGYQTGPTDCDVGAPEALGLPESYATLSVYFFTEADARQALQAFEERGWEGGVVAEVETYCGD